MSVYFTWLFLHTRITPNQVTVLYLILGVLSALACSRYGPGWFALGFVLYRLHVILDVVDGEVARYRKMMSTRGAYLDYMTHYVVYPLLMFSIGYAFYQKFGQPAYLVGGFGMAYARLLNLTAKDAWYRANFGKASQDEIEGTAKREVGPAHRYGLLLIAKLQSVDSQLLPIMPGLPALLMVMTSPKHAPRMPRPPGIPMVRVVKSSI